MTQLGGPKKLKRLAAPKSFKIPRKEYKWTVNPIPGPHSKDKCIPLGILLRDHLKIAKNLREVKYILNKGYVKVDGKHIRTYRYPIGLMDVLELLPTNKAYRILPGRESPLRIVEIPNEEERSIKPLLIKVKTMVKGGRIQLTTHDGRNFLFDRSEVYANLRPGDALIYSTTSAKVIDYVRMEEGNLALVWWGSKRGVVGRIHYIKKPDLLRDKIVGLSTEEGIIETTFEYVFPIGKGKQVITLQ